MVTRSLVVSGETPVRAFSSCPYWLCYKDIYSNITQFKYAELEREILIFTDNSISVGFFIPQSAFELII